MELTARDIILIIIGEGEGRIQGKTNIQKKVYFVGQLLDWDLGYKPHYYGPYSPLIENALGDLRGLGFVNESLMGFGMIDQFGFESRRYDYVLTEDGKSYLERIKKTKISDYGKIKGVLDKIKNAGNPDYFTLSIAAKVIHILSEEKKPLTQSEIIGEAKKFAWKIPDDKLKEAVSFLNKMELAETK